MVGSIAEISQNMARSFNYNILSEANNNYDESEDDLAFNYDLTGEEIKRQLQEDNADIMSNLIVDNSESIKTGERMETETVDEFVKDIPTFSLETNDTRGREQNLNDDEYSVNEDDDELVVEKDDGRHMPGAKDIPEIETINIDMISNVVDENMHNINIDKQTSNIFILSDKTSE